MLESLLSAAIVFVLAYVAHSSGRRADASAAKYRELWERTVRAENDAKRLEAENEALWEEVVHQRRDGSWMIVSNHYWIANNRFDGEEEARERYRGAVEED